MDNHTFQAEWTRHYEGTSACALVADAANDHGPVPDLLPPCFRLTSIERLPAPRGCLNRATLFHEQATMTVEWTSRQPDVNLNRGCLVDIRWPGRLLSVDGTFRIARLVRLDRPKPAVNLFATIPGFGQ
jgi:3'-5' exoribonuclease